jgi:hypothetical protein
MSKLTASRLRALLHYEPSTGVFTWLNASRGTHKGARAGTISRGYRVIRVDGVLYRSARLAVLWMTGHWPQRLVDHRNCIKDDDRWSNLRTANHSQNGANSRARTNFKGVAWDRARGRYAAWIGVNNRNIHLGRFDTAEQAHAAYVAAAERHFGEFARRA